MVQNRNEMILRRMSPKKMSVWLAQSTVYGSQPGMFQISIKIEQKRGRKEKETGEDIVVLGEEETDVAHWESKNTESCEFSIETKASSVPSM